MTSVLRAPMLNRYTMYLHHDLHMDSYRYGLLLSAQLNPFFLYSTKGKVCSYVTPIIYFIYVCIYIYIIYRRQSLNAALLQAPEFSHNLVVLQKNAIIEDNLAILRGGGGFYNHGFFFSCLTPPARAAHLQPSEVVCVCVCVCVCVSCVV